MKEILSGNEAIARGAYEAGIEIATGYPGTPSSEIIKTIALKYGSLLDRVSYYLPYVPGENEEGWRATIEGFAGA